MLREAIALASEASLEGLSIGSLAERLHMSKSGLFAHFGSKVDLQLEALRQVQALFYDNVLAPALRQSPGLPRLRTLFAGWLEWLRGREGIPGGCLMLGASMEYDDRPGPLRDLLASGQRELRGVIAKLIRGAIDEGQFSAEVDPWDLTFEIFGIVLAAHHDCRLLNDPRTFERARTAFERALSVRIPFPQ